MNKSEVDLYLGMALEEALSHRVHSGIFEIMGYLSMVEKETLSDEDRIYISRVEELCRSIVKDLHVIIDNFKSRTKN